MPIRINDAHVTAQFVLGQISDTLADHAPNFDGTFSSSGAFAGVIAANLDPSTANFDGVFDVSPERTGTIGATLATFTSSISSTGQPPTAFTVSNITFIDGAGNQTHDLRQYYLSVIPPGESVIDIRLTGGVLPAAVGINVSAERLDFTDGAGDDTEVQSIDIEVETAGLEVTTFVLQEA